MKKVEIQVTERILKGKGAARKLRRDGKIPAIMYGSGKEQLLVVNEKEWLMRYRYVSSNTIINLKLKNSEHKVLIKDSQEDILSEKVNHIDFYAISEDKKLQTFIPVHLEGNAHGVLEGGILEHKIEELEVICLPKDIPEQFSIDISSLGVGESLHVRDISVPEGVEVRTDEHLTIAVITHARVELEATDEEAVEEEDGDLSLAESDSGDDES